MGKFVFERHFDGGGQKNDILPLLIDSHDSSRTVSGEPNIHHGSFNNVEQFSMDISFNMFYSIAKVDKINSLLACLRRVHFCEMTIGFFIMLLDFYHAVGFLSCCWIFLALHSVFM